MYFKIKCNPGSTDAEVIIMRKIDIKLTKMKRLCECSKGCLETAMQHHHLFSQTNANRKLYGDLVDEDENIKFVSNKCHEKMGHFTEIEFCDALGIEIRSKVAQNKARFQTPVR